MPKAATIFILNERDIEHPLAGGAEVHLMENFSRIAARGYRVVLICANFPGGLAREVIRGIEINRIGNRYTFYFRGPLLFLRLARAVEEGVLVEDLNKLPFFGALYSPFPVMGIVHHLFGWTAFKQVSPPVALATVVAEKTMPPFYRRIPLIAVSPSTRDDLIARGFDPTLIRVIPNGLDHTLYTPGPDDPPGPTVLSLGRVEPYKRLDLLLSAMAIVRQRLPQARLVVTGSGTALDSLKRQANVLGLDSCVEFKGFVSEGEKVRIYRSARVLANPSEKEGWGLTVLEANACGTPAVASDVPGLRDAVKSGKTGILVPHADVPALAEALLRVLADDAEWRRLRQGALDWAGQFSWENVSAELTRAIEEIGFRRRKRRAA